MQASQQMTMLPYRKSRPTMLDHSNGLTKDDIEYIKLMADATTVLSVLGISLGRMYGRKARGPCPIHGGDNKTAFVVNVDTGSWKCYTHDCHVGNSDLIGLVRRVRRCSFIEAVEFITDVCGLSYQTRDRSEILGLLNKKDTQDYINRMESKNFYGGESVLNIEEFVLQARHARASYFDAQYPASILDYFEIGSYRDRFGVTRMLIPVRNQAGEVVAYDGRRTDNDDEPRYLIEPKGFRKNKVLYHYDRAQTYLKAYEGVLFIVEGYKACWSMVQAGYPNVVACMGAGLTGEQPGLIMENLALRKAVLLLDGDEAGRKGTERSKKELQHVCDVDVVSLPDKRDPSNMSVLELSQYLSNYHGGL